MDLDKGWNRVLVTDDYESHELRMESTSIPSDLKWVYRTDIDEDGSGGENIFGQLVLSASSVENLPAGMAKIKAMDIETDGDGFGTVIAEADIVNGVFKIVLGGLNAEYLTKATEFEFKEGTTLSDEDAMMAIFWLFAFPEGVEDNEDVDIYPVIEAKTGSNIEGNDGAVIYYMYADRAVDIEFNDNEGYAIDIHLKEGWNRVAGMFYSDSEDEKLTTNIPENLTWMYGDFLFEDDVDYPAEVIE